MQRFIECLVFSTEDIKRIMTHVSVMQHATLLQMNAEVLKLSEPKSDFISLNSCDWSDWTFYSNRGRWLHFNENTWVTFEQNKTWTELGFLGLVFHDWSRSWTLWSQLAKVKMHKRVELRALGLAWRSSTACVCVTWLITFWLTLISFLKLPCDGCVSFLFAQLWVCMTWQRGAQQWVKLYNFPKMCRNQTLSWPSFVTCVSQAGTHMTVGGGAVRTSCTGTHSCLATK